MEVIKVRKNNHAFLQIDCEPCISNELMDFFAFYVPGYKFMPQYKNKLWDGKIYLYNSRNRELPGGLYKYLYEFVNVRDYQLEVDHNPYYGRPDSTEAIDEVMFSKFVKSLNLTAGDKKIDPRDYQLRAILHGLQNKRALLLSPTASGKSLIIYMLMRYYLETHDKDVLIIVPTTSLVEQMSSDFADYSKYDENFNAKEEVYKIYGGKDKHPSHKPRIIVSTWQSIYQLEPAWFENFGMVIGDEAHNFKAKSLGSIMSKLKEAEYRIGATGTLDGTQTHKLVLEGHFGSVFKVITTKELMNSGALSDLDINVLLLKYNDVTCQSLKKAKYQEEVDFIVRHEKRNKFITNLAVDQDGNTLVLFNFVEKHGKPLYNMIREKAHKSRKVFFVSGETDVDDRERVRQITEKEKDAIIVASLGTFSTGVNIRNLNNIIFASPSKSQIKVLQSIGRGLRKSDNGQGTFLFDIADDLHWKNHKNYTLNHAGERIKIYAKEKFDYTIIEVSLE
jgi:superfamily II DNA or RNA helicase